MTRIKASGVLSDIVGFRDGIFTTEMRVQARATYQQLVNDKQANDLHNTSEAEIIKLVDQILALRTYGEIRQVLEQKGPNLTTFLFVRIQHFVHALEDCGDGFLEMQGPAESVIRWALIDFWNQSTPSDDPY